MTRRMPLALLLFMSACSAAPSPRLVPPRPTPAPSNQAPVRLEPAALAAVPSAASAAAPPAPEPAAAEAPKVVAPVLLERPYSALGHARLGSEMMTLGRDEELFQWALGGSAHPGGGLPIVALSAKIVADFVGPA